MGYSHYWNIPQKIPEKEFRELQVTALQIVNTAAMDFNIIADIEVGTHGHDLFIVVRGINSDDHEPFFLEPSAYKFNFCKTARKPYDTIVVAILAYAEGRKLLTWSSDGDSDDHAKGFDLLNRSNVRAITRIKTAMEEVVQL